MANLPQINKAIKAAGMTDIELVKGKGYFYFIGDNADVFKAGVYTCFVNNLTIAEWVEEARERYKPEE